MTRRPAAVAPVAGLLILLGSMAWAAFAPLPTGARALTFVIPPGTAARLKAGEAAGVLPSPMRGDFLAYGKVYRHLSPEQHAEAHSIAVERHHALNWLCGAGETWDDVPLDT